MRIAEIIRKNEAFVEIDDNDDLSEQTSSSKENELTRIIEALKMIDQLDVSGLEECDRNASIAISRKLEVVQIKNKTKQNKTVS